MFPHGMPEDLDEESVRRIARTFYLARMVRYALLLVALTGFLAASLATGAPRAVAVGLGLAIAALLGGVAVTRRRYVSSQRRPPPGPSSP